MIDIVLINPPLDKKTTSKFPMSGVPLGIAHLTAYIQKKGMKVVAIDAPIEGFNHESLAKEIGKISPLIVGVSCLTENRYSALKTLEIIKKNYPRIITILGGLHPTFTDKLILQNYDFVDFIVRNEGEETLYELMKAIKSKKSTDKILGISFKRNGEIMQNAQRPFIKDINKLPSPAYGSFPIKKYPLPPDVEEGIKQTILFTTSRGCPMGCKFCETTIAWGRTLRGMTAKRIFEEIRYLNKKYGVDYIRFADDLFTLDRQKVIDFCKLIIKNKIRIKFRIQARVDTVSAEMLSYLKKAGCDLIEYGAESGSEKVLKAIGKNITVKKIKEATELTKKAGIEAKFFLIVGALEEDARETWKTFQLIKDAKPDYIGINPLTIYPGTFVYDEAIKKKIIKPDIWLHYINKKTGNSPLYTEFYNGAEMLFLSELGHVWACKNSRFRNKYSLLERILAIILTEQLLKFLIFVKPFRKIAAQFARLINPFLP